MGAYVEISFRIGRVIDQPQCKTPAVIDGIAISGWPTPRVRVETELGIKRTKTGESKYKNNARHFFLGLRNSHDNASKEKNPDIARNNIFLFVIFIQLKI